MTAANSSPPVLGDSLTQVVMNLPFAAIITADGPTPRPVLLTNQAFIDTFGYTLSDVPTDEHWFERAYPDEAYRFELHERWASEVRDAFDTDGVIAAREVGIQTKQGQTKRVLISAQALHGFLITSFVDVSEQRRTEAELRDLIQREIEQHARH